MAELSEILSLSEGADLAGVSPGRLRQLIEEGRLPGKKIGNSWAILSRDLDTFLGKSRSAGRPDERSALAGRLFIDLRSNSPIYLSLVDPIPDFSLWFRVDNRSSLEVELDRVLVTSTFLVPVAEGAILDRFRVEPNKWVDGIHFHKYLWGERVKQLRQVLADENSGQSLRVNATAYFNTPFGSLVVYNHMIDRRRGEFQVNLPPKTA